MSGAVKKRSGFLFGILFMLSASLSHPAIADDKTTFTDLQGAYIVKFARFATWIKPDPALPADEFIIGVVGKNPFGTLLDGKEVNNRPIRIIRFENHEETGPCHVLYINLDTKADIASCLKSLDHSGMLTVSDHPDFLTVGGMIRFVLVNVGDRQKVRWRVNAEPAGEAGINLGMEIQRFALKNGAGK